MDACHALWAVLVMGWTQINAAHVLWLHPSTVSLIVRGLRFSDAHPIPIPGFEGSGCVPRRRHVPARQGELPF